LGKLIKEVRQFVEDHVLLDKHGIVAVSGGPDSVALLRALHELNVPITVAHVNHQLRGEESDGDEEFVKALAGRLKAPFVSTRINLPDSNIEEAARNERYSWFTSLGGDWLVTGHTADDQAETVLHRIIRGTGLDGLQGIFTLITPRGCKGPSILRPLLKVTRTDVLNYLDFRKQPFRTDSSNEDPRFTRNRIRHEVMPLLKEFNPEIVSVLHRLSEQAEEAQSHINRESTALYMSSKLPPAGAVVILDRDMLVKAKQLIRIYTMRIVWMVEHWPKDRMTYDHWQRLANLEPGDYPGGIRLTLTERVVQLGPRQ